MRYHGTSRWDALYAIGIRTMGACSTKSTTVTLLATINAEDYSIELFILDAVWMLSVVKKLLDTAGILD